MSNNTCPAAATGSTPQWLHQPLQSPAAIPFSMPHFGGRPLARMTFSPLPGTMVPSPYRLATPTSFMPINGGRFVGTMPTILPKEQRQEAMRVDQPTDLSSAMACRQWLQSTAGAYEKVAGRNTQFEELIRVVTNVNAGKMNVDTGVAHLITYKVLLEGSGVVQIFRNVLTALVGHNQRKVEQLQAEYRINRQEKEKYMSLKRPLPSSAPAIIYTAEIDTDQMVKKKKPNQGFGFVPCSTSSTAWNGTSNKCQPVQTSSAARQMSYYTLNEVINAVLRSTASIELDLFRHDDSRLDVPGYGVLLPGKVAAVPMNCVVVICPETATVLSTTVMDHMRHVLMQLVLLCKHRLESNLQIRSLIVRQLHKSIAIDAGKGPGRLRINWNATTSRLPVYYKCDDTDSDNDELMTEVVEVKNPRATFDTLAARDKALYTKYNRDYPQSVNELHERAREKFKSNAMNDQADAIAEIMKRMRADNVKAKAKRQEQQGQPSQRPPERLPLQLPSHQQTSKPLVKKRIEIGDLIILMESNNIKWLLIYISNDHVSDIVATRHLNLSDGIMNTPNVQGLRKPNVVDLPVDEVEACVLPSSFSVGPANKQLRSLHFSNNDVSVNTFIGVCDLDVLLAQVATPDYRIDVETGDALLLYAQDLIFHMIRSTMITVKHRINNNTPITADNKHVQAGVGDGCLPTLTVHVEKRDAELAVKRSRLPTLPVSEISERICSMMLSSDTCGNQRLAPFVGNVEIH